MEFIFNELLTSTGDVRYNNNLHLTEHFGMGYVNLFSVQFLLSPLVN